MYDYSDKRLAFGDEQQWIAIRCFINCQ